jgi:hypothetical protein
MGVLYRDAVEEHPVACWRRYNDTTAEFVVANQTQVSFKAR